MKRQPEEQEKICANNISDKGAISKICKELIQLNGKKKKRMLQFKNGRGTEQTFFQTDVQKVYTKWYSTSLNIKKIQIKATMRYHFTPLRMAIIKKTRENLLVGYREKRTLAHC